jgi:excisionase family DNA binding protein
MRSRRTGEGGLKRAASQPPAQSDPALHVVESLLTPEAVARLLACSPKSVYAWAARGDLLSVRLGRLVRFRPSDVRRFIEANAAR